jgi:hypothetical protein
MAYTLSEAAEVTGRSRGAIIRALQTGEVAATHDEATDEWAIEPNDLFRVFPVAYHIRFVLEAVEPLRSKMRELRSRLEAAEAAISATGKRLDAKVGRTAARTTGIGEHRNAAPSPPLVAAVPARC